MVEFDRRALLAAGFATLGSAAWGAPAAKARLRLRPDEVLNKIPANYSGFSAETAQLSDPAFYHPENASLIALHRRLSPNGVLRLGGNSSEFCWWKATPDANPPEIKVMGQGRADNFMPQRFTSITPAAVDNLGAFLDACGWSCIWGLNLGTGSPERDGEEAAHVAKALGEKLLFFQIGNEPDLYTTANNLLRPAGWSFADYLNEWTAIAEAVSTRVPGARFGGPDGSADWVVRFAEEAPKRLGAPLAGLSAHYYAEGPPNSPNATTANLLKADPRIAEGMNAIAPVARALGLPFRMTEGNSCYRGGKPGMSDALASALWGGDYMLDMAARGCKGINFHGGSGAEIAGSLGDKLPGAQSAADLEVARLGTFYSPFAGNRTEGFSARPIFYGMMLVEQFAGTTLVANTFDALGANATAYSAKAGNNLRIALFNKDAGRDLDVRIDLAGPKVRRATAWRLTGPALDATKGIMLAGAEVGQGNAAWRPRRTQAVHVRAATLAVSLPRASALLLFVES
jgi:hypothetical protein